MSDLDDLVEDLKQKRDEVRVQINLASREIKDEWKDLEEKMDEFSGRVSQFAGDAQLKETGEGLGQALGEVGKELKRGYERIRDAIKED